MSTVNMNVHSPFNLIGDRHEKLSFKAGIQAIPAEYADHWYVLQNATALPEGAPAQVGELGEDGEPLQVGGVNGIDDIAKREADARLAQNEPVPVPADSESAADIQDTPDETQETATEIAADEAEKAGDTAVDPNADLEGMSRHQLAVEATKLGLTVDGRWNQDRIREEIAKARAKV